SVRPARPDAAVLLARAFDRDRVLHEAVGAPAAVRVVADLHDGVGALALLLRQRNHSRVVAALVRAHAARYAPVFVERVGDVELVGARGEPELGAARVGLRAQRDPVGHGVLERSAVVLGVRQRLQAGRRIAAVQALRVDSYPAAGAVEEVAQSHAQVRAIAAGVRVGERRRVVPREAEAAVVGAPDRRDEAFRLRALQLEPRVGVDAYRDVGRFEAAIEGA